MSTHGLVEQTAIATYNNNAVGNYGFVDFKEVCLLGQSPYNPAVSGLAAFLREHGSAHEGAESIAKKLVMSQNRHFVATDDYGMNAGEIFGYAATTSIKELVNVPRFVARGGALMGDYARTMAALLHAALEDELILDRPLMADVPNLHDSSFFTNAGMYLNPAETEGVAQASSLVAVYNTLQSAYGLGA